MEHDDEIQKLEGEILDLKEQLRILKTLSVYSDREHFFLVPDNLDTRKRRKQFNQSVIVTMPNWFFRTIDHYNIMMLQPKLYTIFQQFEFILLCQPDAFLINKMNSNAAFNLFVFQNGSMHIIPIHALPPILRQ